MLFVAILGRLPEGALRPSGGLVMDRRSFIKTAAVGTAGAALAWKFGGTLALAQLPDETSSVPIEQANGLAIDRVKFLRKNKGISNEAPRIAIDGAGNPWASWIEEDDAGEHLYATTFAGGSFTEAEDLSAGGNGFVTHPRLRPWAMGAAAVWAERQSFGHWNIAVRRTVAPNVRATMDGSMLLTVRINEPGVAWRPDYAVTPKDEHWVVYERRIGERFEIVARPIQGDRVGEAVVVSDAPAEDCCRPSAIADKKGRLWVSWDQTDGAGGPQVWIACIEEGTVAERHQVTHHPAENIASALDHDGDRLWIAWQSNRRSRDEWDIPRWIYLRAFKDGKFYDPIGTMPGKDLTKRGVDQSFEFPRVICGPDGRVVLTGRPSHNFCVQSYHGAEWSPLYRIPEDGWGGRGQYLDAAFDNEGNLWVARRDLRINVLSKITGFTGEKRSPKLERTRTAEDLPRIPANAVRSKPKWDPLEDLEGISEPLNVYFGDLHGHTWMSDGLGDVDEWYRLRRDYYGDDFGSLTDHDNFVGNGILPSEWEFIKEVTRHWHEDGRFVTLYGQEFTTARYPTFLGHKCVYTLDHEVPLFDHTDPVSNTSKKLNGLVRQWKGILFPHHTGWTGTDWENAEEDIQMLAEIVSNHGRFEFMGNRPIPHRGGARGCFLQDGLARGLKFGFIGGTDSHGLIWHHRVGWKRDCNRTGLAAVLAPNLSREAIFDALRRRRTYATTGIKPRLDFRVNGHLMGEEITLAPGENVRVSVNVTGDVELKTLEIVRNNEIWHTYGGEGWQSRYSVVDDEVPAGTSWYYLRVEFESGDMAWSSPVWVTR
ncbi:MAG: hypothetical protein PWP23_367 [Candidatus Sumerlaeota bacterium]|nr:hypothetical protein [Candidatus Sumerlaeota bacterium]